MVCSLSYIFPNSPKSFQYLSNGRSEIAFYEWARIPHDQWIFAILIENKTKIRWVSISASYRYLHATSAKFHKGLKTRNLVGRGTGARVQIPSPPPVIHRDAFRIGVDFLSLSTLFDSREVLLWIFPSAGHPQIRYNKFRKMKSR